jgi:hypothetical protein
MLPFPQTDVLLGALRGQAIMTAFKKKLASACLNALYLLVATGLIASPFLLELDASAAVIRNQVILGVLFGVFALWSMATEERARAPLHSNANLTAAARRHRTRGQQTGSARRRDSI